MDTYTRRQMMLTGAALAGGAALGNAAQGADQTNQPPEATGDAFEPAASQKHQWDSSYSGGPINVKSLPPGLPIKDYKPVVVPNGHTLGFKIVDSVKVFHLIAEEIVHEVAPGLVVNCWGYNGRMPGPTIEVVEGDRVRIYVTNRLMVPTSVHGLFSRKVQSFWKRPRPSRKNLFLVAVCAPSMMNLILTTPGRWFLPAGLSVPRN